MGPVGSLGVAGRGVEAGPFRLAGPLPGPGITVIEASAGTGKTHALTSLVVRYVAEGVPLSALLAVTFTKMATGELRDRVRTRLVESHQRVSDELQRRGDRSEPDRTPAEPTATGSDDEALAGLLELPSAGLRECGTRLADALADFDSATIATTHGFCQMVLYGLGTAGDTIPGTTLLEDPADLIEEVVDDLYLRRSLMHPQTDPPFSLAQARSATLEAVRNPGTALLPVGGDDECGLLRRLAERAREEIGRRLLEGQLLTYDQLLYRLACTLDDPRRGPVACRRLGQRYQVVLVDEFQDTDPVQWTVLRRAFTGGSTRLILIGDPKQAVYAFRGADVHAYLDAARSAGAVHTLDVNWRADQPLLSATDALLAPLQFGHPEITFRSVSAPPDRQQSGLTAAPDPAPMRWRLVQDSERGIPMTTKSLLRKPALAEWIARDVARDILALLRSGAELTEPGGRRHLQERDVAVLTRTNAQALAVRDELRALGVQSVVSGLDSVLGSDAADAWLRLLEALQEPASRSRAAAVALGPWFGMTPVEVATADEARWEGVHERLHRWAAVLAGRGVAALYRTLTVEQGLPGQVLRRPGGERLLTDLGHVAQLLHAEASDSQLVGPSLRSWLSARIRSVGEEQSEVEDRSRRLDSDAEAVQVLTIHGAKGLEFPVVYCPYLWDAGKPEKGSPPVVFHDPAAGEARTVDVGCPVGPGPARTRYLEHAAQARAERRGEDLRLLYVALTRARHQLVIWWGRTQDCRHSPLGRLLVGRDGLTGEVGEARGGEPSGRQIRQALETVAARAPGLIRIETASLSDPAPRPDQAEGRPAGTSELGAASFSRSLDLRWRRASYTSITATLHGRGSGESVGSEPEAPGIADEPVHAAGLARTGPDIGSAPFEAAGSAPFEAAGSAPFEAADGPPCPLAALPGGAMVGTFVHRVLERVDFASGDRRAALDAAIRDVAGREGGGLDPQVLTDGLIAALGTPLGSLVPGATLSDIGRGDRLDELSFELPVAGGELPIGSVRPADVAGLLREYEVAGGPLAGYADRLLDPALDTSLRGYLTGSLDLVFRRVAADGVARWYVADYKSNWLGPTAGSLSVHDYRPDQLEREMQSRHYPLQALIYSVALHRYLRWRQAGYAPERHLGGVLYLFLRGMCGPDTPAPGGSPHGVWSWAVPPDLVVRLSELFERGAA